MDDVPDKVQIFASNVSKDAANRDIFLGYNSRLRGLFVVKEGSGQDYTSGTSLLVPQISVFCISSPH